MGVTQGIVGVQKRQVKSLTGHRKISPAAIPEEPMEKGGGGECEGWCRLEELWVSLSG